MQDSPIHAAFPVTQWSLIARACSDDPQARTALNELVLRYLPALRAHLVLTRRFSEDDADELLQSFLACKVVENGLVSRADRTLGKFRTLLLSALSNYLLDQVRYRQARKRTAEIAGPIDAVGDSMLAEGNDPTSAFDVAWARQVITRGVELMREECTRIGRMDLWGVFHGRVLAPTLEGAEPATYEALIRQHGFATPDQASNALMTGKRMFARTLRLAVAEYADAEDVEQELQDLRRVLAGG